MHKPGKSNLVPEALSRAPIDAVHSLHASISLIKELQSFFNEGEVCRYILQNGIYITSDRKIVIPESEINKLLHVYLELGNHAGQNKLLSIIPSIYFSPKLCKNIVFYVRSCHICQTSNHANRPIFGKLRPISTPKDVFDFIFTDTV